MSLNVIAYAVDALCEVIDGRPRRCPVPLARKSPRAPADVDGPTTGRDGFRQLKRRPQCIALPATPTGFKPHPMRRAQSAP